MGKYGHISGSADEFAREKQEDILLEELKNRDAKAARTRDHIHGQL
jgi:hypothetical protein